MQKNKEGLFDKNYFEKNAQGKHAPIGYNDAGASLFAQIIGKALYESIGPKRSVDIGCAKGYLVDFLYKSGIDAWGLDISSYAVSQATPEIKQRLFVVDAEDEALPFPEDYADLITILEVLEHLHSFKLIAAEIKRILQKGGYLLISTPTPWGRFVKIDPTHVSVKPPGYWRRLFAKEGFIPAERKIWEVLKKTFLKEFKEAMPGNPPTTGISATLQKMGSIGCALRSTLPYIDYFSLLRSDEVMLLKKSL
ncbi:MAG: methyltransferase domain-containing protein [Candidatus Omnitrophota bacterium]